MFKVPSIMARSSGSAQGAVVELRAPERRRESGRRLADGGRLSL